MNYPYRTWYVTLIAASYLLLCSVNLVILTAWYFQGGLILTPWMLITLGTAVSGGLYLFRPRLSHRALIGLTVIALLAIGESDPDATRFYLIVLALLILPYFTCRPKRMP